MTTKTKDLISFTHNYNIVPAKLTILYKRNSNLDEVFKSSIISYPILSQVEKPDANTLSMVYRSSEDSEIFLFLGKDISLSIIVHECIHIVSEIFAIMGVSHNPETEEFYAYIMDYTFEQVYNYCKDILNLKLPLSISKQ